MKKKKKQVLLQRKRNSKQVVPKSQRGKLAVDYQYQADKYSCKTKSVHGLIGPVLLILLSSLNSKMKKAKVIIFRHEILLLNATKLSLTANKGRKNTVESILRLS